MFTKRSAFYLDANIFPLFRPRHLVRQPVQNLTIRAKILDRAGLILTDDAELTMRYENGAAILTSRSTIPGEIFADPRDRRCLGVKIAALVAGGRQIPLDHPLLIKGWHGCEIDGRWTDGRAVIPAELLHGQGDLHIQLAATLRYPMVRPYGHMMNSGCR